MKQEYSIKLDVVFFIYRCFSSLRCFGCQKNLALDSKAFKYSLRSVSESKWNENTILNEFVHLIIKFESLIERVRWKEKLFFFWKVPLSLILFGSMFRVNSCSVIVFFAYFNELCCFWCVDFAPFFPIVEIKSLNFFGFCCDIKAAWYFCNSLLFFFSHWRWSVCLISTKILRKQKNILNLIELDFLAAENQATLIWFFFLG